MEQSRKFIPLGDAENVSKRRLRALFPLRMPVNDCLQLLGDGAHLRGLATAQSDDLPQFGQCQAEDFLAFRVLCLVERGVVIQQMIKARHLLGEVSLASHDFHALRSGAQRLCASDSNAATETYEVVDMVGQFVTIGRAMKEPRGCLARTEAAAIGVKFRNDFSRQVSERRHVR